MSREWGRVFSVHEEEFRIVISTEAGTFWVVNCFLNKDDADLVGKRIINWKRNDIRGCYDFYVTNDNILDSVDVIHMISFNSNNIGTHIAPVGQDIFGTVDNIYKINGGLVVTTNYGKFTFLGYHTSGSRAIPSIKNIEKLYGKKLAIVTQTSSDSRVGTIITNDNENFEVTLPGYDSPIDTGYVLFLEEEMVNPNVLG